MFDAILLCEAAAPPGTYPAAASPPNPAHSVGVDGCSSRPISGSGCAGSTAQGAGASAASAAAAACGLGTDVSLVDMAGAGVSVTRPSTGASERSEEEGLSLVEKIGLLNMRGGNNAGGSDQHPGVGGSGSGDRRHLSRGGAARTSWSGAWSLASSEEGGAASLSSSHASLAGGWADAVSLPLDLLDPEGLEETKVRVRVLSIMQLLGE